MISIPKYANEETRMRAARIIALQLIGEAGVEGDLGEVAADIAKHCKYGDGFQMAKDLERAGWDCNLEIAEVLDGFGSVIDREHNKYLAQYAKDHSIEEPFPVGSLVNTCRGSGTITAIYEHRPLSYLVKIDGDARAEPPTNARLILWFDEVTVINSGAEL